MDHTKILNPDSTIANKGAVDRATGRFYTHSFIIEDLIESLFTNTNFIDLKEISIIDPFCGDGRLIAAFIDRLVTTKRMKDMRWHISLWDYDEQAVDTAKANIEQRISQYDLSADLVAKYQDTFTNSSSSNGTYDVVITNPPWEAIKPDKREMGEMSSQQCEDYIQALKEYDRKLVSLFPHSQPVRKFAGWGTNLSRCGTEVSLRLTRVGGVCGIVVPSSLLTDQMTISLRKWILNNATIASISYYPAEARLFKNVDQPSISSVIKKQPFRESPIRVKKYLKDCTVDSEFELKFSKKEIEALDYNIPIEYGPYILKTLAGWGKLARFESLEGKEDNCLWAGRELDETNHKIYLTETGRFKFIKGRMLGRFSIVEEPTHYINEELRKIPVSANFYRIAWRDVSRRNQARRMQAAIIPPGVVSGNSLHVAYFRDSNLKKLRALLAIVNSVPFEFQIRSRLGTGHVSLGVVRKAHILNLCNSTLIDVLSALVEDIENGDKSAEYRLEIIVAKAYGLDKDRLGEILNSFNRLSNDIKERLLSNQAWDEEIQIIQDEEMAVEKKIKPKTESDISDIGSIPNHYSAKLSDLDLQMAVSIPPGGNWKNIPLSIPSKRLEQIRESYAAGKGSRSTYYGRLEPGKPSYTISTNFNRPGNGCHLHYDFDGKQHRVISQREAARLQSFPDSFVFTGSKGSINKQIGNAVPPLLGYQIALCFPYKGQFLDLFSGAGGLSLGFRWAGWKPILANDIDKSFLSTYQENTHDQVILGDIRNQEIQEAIFAQVKSQRKEGIPLLVLGGPPCQGFSTAGNRRSMEDDRNLLFYEYKAMLEALKPDGFLFENVTGLLNMEGGRVFETVKSELQIDSVPIVSWKVKSEQFAIPQRRTRIFLMASNKPIKSLRQITDFEQKETLFENLTPAITVSDALSDLPPLKNSEDGSQKDYVSDPVHPYQELMRSHLTPDKYIEKLMRA
ncbi:Alw26I/Eco31I/Esp3I family type II restriction adenine-specific DNA-methyltransferase [Candidatus Latescibacteria bacterium]|nr:Alw26I/Eco31I/Esp3I family type II restriction adenine-specific DNA-methyltransferase [Candidatus Latescibacterota bacterium]